MRGHVKIRRLMMGRVYLFLADGFEEIEGLTVVDILRRAGIGIQTVSVTGSRNICGAHEIHVEADVLFEEGDFGDADMLVLPGGMPGTRNLGEHRGLCGLLREAAGAGRKIAAICAAPSVLGDLGLLEGRDAVCYPGFEDRLKGARVLEEDVVVDGNITTSRGMGTALPFALKLAEQLVGSHEAVKIGQSVMFLKS